MARFERVTDGIPHLLVPHEDNAQRRLLVTFATHKGGARFAAVESIRRSMPVDFLGFRDPDNGYYLYQDGGVRFGTVLRGLVAAYEPARVLFFGSSMAGYAALRWALELNASCVVSNPQVNLDATIPHVWRELRENIERIPRRVNLDQVRWRDRRAVLTVLHGRHPMDIENMRRLFAIWLRTPGMALNLTQVDEDKHSYLIRDFAQFRRLCEDTWRQRLALEEQAVAAPA